MDARELRIGNYVKYNDFLTQEEIITITPRWFSSLAGGRSFKEQAEETELNYMWTGIPITEEWLFRFGFEKGDIAIYFPLNTWHDGFLDFIDGEIKLRARHNGIERHIQITNIKYVHQLQNLFFALTGMELKVRT